MSVFDAFRLDGRRALVTGGSRGLGRAMARAFAEAGADLVLVGRDADSLRQAQEELSALGRDVRTVAADLSAPDEAERLCEAVLRDAGPVDVLVNNVGGRRENVPIEDTPLEMWRRYLDLNLTSAFICTRRLGAAMRERRWGRVLNIASIAGGVAFRGIHGRHYETAKAALVGFTKAAAADWAADGVTVNAIAPGVFLTDPNRRWFGQSPEYEKDVLGRIPMGRFGRPEEIAPLALYLASDAGAYVTGAVLVIDGGYTLW
jgi:NAD(P)-dependent dehydrogenase (short-subunit alcohol dehydrogenase family)